MLSFQDIAIDIVSFCKVYYGKNHHYQRNKNKKTLFLKDTSKFKQMRQIYLEKSKRELKTNKKNNLVC